jgi:hypothetical protein
MRITILWVALAVVAASCGGESPDPTTTEVPEAGPRQVVAGWVGAVMSGDAERLADLVEPEGVIVLAAVENGLSEEATAALLDEGMPPELVDEYWRSFRNGFTEFAGVALQSLEVGGYEEFGLGDIAFASVVVASGDAVTSVMTSRRADRWQLDLMGSFGPAFAAQLRRSLMGLSDSADAERIRQAYRDAVIPGLLAAFRRAPGNRVLGAELERMTLLLER